MTASLVLATWPESLARARSSGSSITMVGASASVGASVWKSSELLCMNRRSPCFSRACGGYSIPLPIGTLDTLP